MFKTLKTRNINLNKDVFQRKVTGGSNRKNKNEGPASSSFLLSGLSLLISKWQPLWANARESSSCSLSQMRQTMILFVSGKEVSCLPFENNTFRCIYSIQ